MEKILLHKYTVHAVSIICFSLLLVAESPHGSVVVLTAGGDADLARGDVAVEDGDESESLVKSSSSRFLICSIPWR